MNVYRVIEDGEDFCIRAKTMQEAVKVCETSYLDGSVNGPIEELSEELRNECEYYHEQVLESCELVGELKN